MRSGHQRHHRSTGRGLVTASAVLAALCLLLAGCGGGGDTGSGGGASGSSTSTAPPASATSAPGAEEAPPVPSSACRTPGADPVREARQAVTVAGTERAYLLTAPPAATGRDPVPLVLDFHGLDGAASQARLSGFSDLAEERGFVVAYPEAVGSPVAWNTNIANNNLDLVTVDAIIEAVGGQFCIDTGRIYASGFSTGAEFVTTLACLRSQRIAAVVAVAGVDRKNRCAPSRQVPIMAVHGTADGVFLFNGGVGDVGRILTGGDAPPAVSIPPADLDGDGIPLNVAQWAQANGCAPTPTDTDVAPSVIRRTFDCSGGAEVVFYVIEGGGHTWPGSTESVRRVALLGPTNTEFDATAAAWDFLRRQHLPQG